jgi:chromosome partitioning protein
MRVWSFVSQKGGSGKTTLALHLAIAAASKGRTTLVLDLDPQNSAERWSHVRDENSPDIVAGHPDKTEEMLRKAEEHGADLVMIDTPPKVDRTALIAAKVADMVLIPARGTILDLQAIGDTINLLKLASLEGKAAIVLNAMPNSAAQVAEIEDAAEAYGIDIIDARLAERPAFSRSLKDGLGATESRGAAATEIWALYKRLCERDAALLRRSKRARP